MPAMKVLIADDDSSFRVAMERQLAKWGYEVIAVSNGLDALDVMNGDDPPRMVLLDWMMPGLEGIEACRRMRASTEGDYCYIVLLTAKGGRENVIQGIEAGADDYVVKPFDSQELKVRLRAGRRIIELQEALQREASTDSLTGLTNRNAIYETVKRELQRAHREDSHLAVAMVDIDNFKRFNDTHGHLAGDECLQGVATRLAASIRSYDSAGRWGGEEFLFVFPGCDLGSAEGMAERLRRSVGDQELTVRGIGRKVTISVGICCRGAGAARDADRMIETADRAMYVAKEAGRNRIRQAVLTENSSSL